MANILDYLDWRGDIPFSLDPFNEVDNLILSQLSYVQFADEVPAPGAGAVRIDEVCRRFFSRCTEKEILSQDTFVKTAPFLLKKMSGTRRFKGTRIGRYVNIVSEDDEEQMSAVTFFLEDGTSYVAFRGTDNTIVGWKEDFCLSFMEETGGQRSAADYLTRTLRETEGAVRVGGHSKGGNFAVYAAAFCQGEARDRICQVWTNDGPGFLAEVTQREAYREMLSRIRSIIPAYSIFGLLLESGYGHQVIASSLRGIYQHDAMSWQVLGSHFVAAPGTTGGSAFWEKTIDSWVAGFDLEERKNFVDLAFDLIYSAGAETVSELKADKMKNYREMMKNFRAMKPEDQKVLTNTMRALLKSGAQTLWEDAPGPQEMLAYLKDRLTPRGKGGDLSGGGALQKQ